MQFTFYSAVALAGLAMHAHALKINEDDEFAQIGAELETMAMTEAEIEEELADNREFFTSFLAQMGIQDGGSLLAQLGDHMSQDQIDALIMDPKIYSGLAQIASDYYGKEPSNTHNVLSQISSETSEEEVDQLLAQLSTEELQELEANLS